ncbi:hypothetical protein P353_06840 [Comamonas testosteroni]|uniref:Uncharacterized protein n=1 Tax=Comamonas testosteroni TaxID=285 RepID=A0A096FMV0_COMTE|nr:hypothetical protein P353_06840 [Comamonas testosteroni]
MSIGFKNFGGLILNSIPWILIISVNPVALVLIFLHAVLVLMFCLNQTLKSVPFQYLVLHCLKRKLNSMMKISY